MFYRQSTAEAAADLRGASARPVFAEPREFAEPGEFAEPEAPAALAALTAAAVTAASVASEEFTAAAVAAHDSARTKAIDNGLDQLVNAIAELAAFETRLEQVEQDVTHGRALGMTPLPTAGDVGVNEYKPRLAEAALLIAALARRMNLRLGAVERALEGRLPVGQDAAPVGEERPQSAKKPAAAKKRPAAKMKTSAKKKPAVKKTLAKKPVVKKPTTKKLVVKPPVTKTQAAKKQPAEAKQAGAAKPSEDTAPPAEKKRQAAA